MLINQLTSCESLGANDYHTRTYKPTSFLHRDHIQPQARLPPPPLWWHNKSSVDLRPNTFLECSALFVS